MGEDLILVQLCLGLDPSDAKVQFDAQYRYLVGQSIASSSTCVTYLGLLMAESQSMIANSLRLALARYAHFNCVSPPSPSFTKVD